VTKNDLEFLLSQVMGSTWSSRWKHNTEIEFKNLLKHKKNEFKIIDRFNRFQKDSVVLDYGTGLGLIATHIGKKVKKVYCWDVEQGMIDYCRKTYKDLNNLEILDPNSSIENISVSHIVAINVISENYSLEKFKELLKMFSKILDKNGSIWFDFRNEKFRKDNYAVSHAFFHFNISDLETVINSIGAFEVRLLDTNHYHAKVLLRKIS